MIWGEFFNVLENRYEFRVDQLWVTASAVTQHNTMPDAIEIGQGGSLFYPTQNSLKSTSIVWNSVLFLEQTLIVLTANLDAALERPNSIYACGEYACFGFAQTKQGHLETRRTGIDRQYVHFTHRQLSKTF
jgi:hypothetical protein